MRVRTRELVATAAIAGYLLFTASLMLAVIAAGAAVQRAALVVALLAISLPALGAWLYIDFTRWAGRELASRVVRWAAMGVGLVASGLGFLIAIWNFSRVAALVVLLEMGVLYLAISGLFMIKGKLGLKWRGLALVTVGVLVPVIYLYSTGGPEAQKSKPDPASSPAAPG